MHSFSLSPSLIQLLDRESQVCCHPSVYTKYRDLFGWYPPSFKHMHTVMTEYLQVISILSMFSLLLFLIVLIP